jgi:hypothetical protein
MEVLMSKYDHAKAKELFEKMEDARLKLRDEIDSIEDEYARDLAIDMIISAGLELSALKNLLRLGISYE